MHSLKMNNPSNRDNINSTLVDSYRVLCKGCTSILPLPLFLHPVDDSCYRVRMQCKRCINKSQKHWRTNRDDIKAARATRERNIERVTCVCGISINVRYRTKHCQSKRHLSVVAVLREHNALPSNAAASNTPAGAERKGQTLQEVEAFIAATEQRLATNDALRERRRSLSTPPEPSPLHRTTPAWIPPPFESWMKSTADSAATPRAELAQSSGENISHLQHGESENEPLDGTEEHAGRIEHG